MSHADRVQLQRSGSRAVRFFWRCGGAVILGAAILFGLVLGMSGIAAERAPWNANRVIGSPLPPAPYAVERLYPKLKFDRPVDVAAMPGEGRIMVLEQGGKLFSFPAKADAERADLMFDFREAHQPFDSAFAFALHPRFQENRFIYVCYVEPGTRAEGSHVSRFTVRASEPPTIEPGSEKVILRWLSGGHNGCTLAFGKDGFLYISTGDAASPDPPDQAHRTGQDISDLLASILRIDVERAEGTNHYAIPADNPFVKTPGARPEVYAFGFRNPWRMSFDDAGELWVGDVGWEQWEMIYLVEAGGNYGWSLAEGPNKQVRTDVTPGPGPILPALVALPHSDAASITGGRVYYGAKLPELKGAYLYGDWETGKFWALRQEEGRLISNVELCDTTLRPVSFAADDEKELLILDYNGGIYGFVPNRGEQARADFPRKLSETGLFRETSELTPKDGVISYRPNAVMWNDGAAAEHLLGIPGVEQIVTSGGRETITGRMWHYPSNTVFARTLTLEMEKGKALSRKRIETQLMHFDGQTWNPHTFRWNGEQTDAALVPPEGTNEVFVVLDAGAPGGRREIHWRFGSRAECLRCHNVWASDTLSFNWPQLGHGAGSEMERLRKLGFIEPRNPPSPVVGLVNPQDRSKGLEARARSWLHVNCAGCHRFGAGGGVPSQLNYDQPAASTRTIDAVPVRGEFGISAARVIAPGEPFRSVLFYRISTEGPGHMPQIGSRLVDEEGVALVRDWIGSLPRSESQEPEVIAARQAAEIHREWMRQLEGAEQGEAIKNLLGNTSGALVLLDSVALPQDRSLREGELEKLRQRVLAAAQENPDPIVRGLFERLLPPEQRRQTLGGQFDPQVVLGLRGDRERGRDVFHGVSQCASCHVVEGAGRAYGPDLTRIGQRYGREELLAHIIEPGKFVAPEYGVVSLTLKDGTEWSGFVVNRSENELMIRDGAGGEHRVRFGDIQEEVASRGSPMPEGLLGGLIPQEAADLLEYLMAGAEREE